MAPREEAASRERKEPRVGNELVRRRSLGSRRTNCGDSSCSSSSSLSAAAAAAALGGAVDGDDEPAAA